MDEGKYFLRIFAVGFTILLFYVNIFQDFQWNIIATIIVIFLWIGAIWEFNRDLKEKQDINNENLKNAKNEIENLKNKVNKLRDKKSI